MLEEKQAGQPRPHDWSHFIIQKAPAGVITLDGQRRITTCNPAAEEITGYSEAQILGRLTPDMGRWSRRPRVPGAASMPQVARETIYIDRIPK